MDLQSQDPIFNANLGQDKNIWNGYIYDFYSILEANLDPDETFIWDPIYLIVDVATK